MSSGTMAFSSDFLEWCSERLRENVGKFLEYTWTDIFFFYLTV